jgi:uncharacterized membrane protein
MLLSNPIYTTLVILSFIFLYALGAALTKEYFKYKGTPLEDGKERYWIFIIIIMFIDFLYNSPFILIELIKEKIIELKTNRKNANEFKIVEERKKIK